MARGQTGLAIGAMLLIAGCGGASTSGNSTAGTATATDTAAGAMPANFKATDACSVISNATMEQVLGVKVTESSLALVHELTPGAGDAATSECTYILAEGRASVMTRWSPINDNTDEAMNASKSTMEATLKGFGGGTVEEVAGVGKRSFWVAKVDQLQSFIGNDRMVLITVPSSADSRAKAIALAKKAGA